MDHRPETLDLRAALLQDALTILEAEYASQLELDDVARRVLTSRRQLQRCFTDLHGSTFRTTLREMHMRRATELLETGMPVGEIARAVGYTQPAQFAKAFRRTFGTSPTQFRAGQAAASATGTRGAA